MTLNGGEVLKGISFVGPRTYESVQVVKDVILLEFSKPVDKIEAEHIGIGAYNAEAEEKSKGTRKA